MKEEAFKAPSTSTPFFNQTIIVNVTQKAIQDGILSKEAAQYLKHVWTNKLINANVDPPFMYQNRNILQEHIEDKTEGLSLWLEPSAGTLTNKQIFELPDETNLFDDIEIPKDLNTIPAQSKQLISSTGKFECTNDLWYIKVDKNKMYVYANICGKDYIYSALKLIK